MSFASWLRSVLGIKDDSLPASLVRSKNVAASLKAESLATIARGATGSISCPWHQDLARNCKFDQNNQTYYCYGCARNGSMTTLVRRLQDAGVYERAVE